MSVTSIEYFQGALIELFVSFILVKHHESNISWEICEAQLWALEQVTQKLVLWIFVFQSLGNLCPITDIYSHRLFMNKKKIRQMEDFKNISKRANFFNHRYLCKEITQRPKANYLIFIANWWAVDFFHDKQSTYGSVSPILRVEYLNKVAIWSFFFL